MSSEKFQEILKGPLAQYLTISSQIGDPVSAQSQMVQKAFNAQLKYISATCKRQPKQADIADLLHPISQYIKTVQEFCNRNRASPLYNHLSAIGEGVSALAWVTVGPAPAHYIKEVKDAGEYYANRVLRDWKALDRTHIDWVNAWTRTLTQLESYVLEYHTTASLKPKSNADKENLRISGEIVKSTPSLAQDIKTATPMAPSEKPPRFIRNSNKWFIEHQRGNHNLVVSDAQMDNAIYLYKCTDSTVCVKGKVNSIVLDSCKKTSIVFDSVISSVEFINCQRVQMQVTGKVSTISVMKTDGCQIYLSQESLDAEMISSKSSEMNVLVPKDGGDYVEYPLPEQYKSTLVPNQGIVTTVLDTI